jgi:hypothetical protein
MRPFELPERQTSGRNHVYHLASGKRAVQMRPDRPAACVVQRRHIRRSMQSTAVDRFRRALRSPLQLRVSIYGGALSRRSVSWSETASSIYGDSEDLIQQRQSAIECLIGSAV